MCYLGGYGWSIMVANVCQKFPDLSPSQLIARFFDTYANWNWKEQAVVLDVKPKISYSLDPKKDVLAVITLSRPFRNTARNVTKTALSVLKAEFAQARAVTNSKSPVWSLVLRQSDFFTQYKSYLKVVTSAVSADEFARWKGWVESRLVSLCHNLDLQGVFAHSFPVAFPNKESAYPYSVFYFIGVKKFEKKDEAAPEASNDKPTEQKPLDFAQTIYKFQDMLTGWNDKSAGMDVQIKHIKGDRLPAIVFEQSLDLDYLQIAAAESSDEASSSDEAVVPSSPPKVTSPGVPVGSATAKKVGGFPPTPKSQQPAKKSGKKKGKIESPKKKRIRPSWDVFNRILWDPKLSKENFIIGYLDRFEGIMEVPAFEFDNSTIPWHRVYYFRRDGEVVWDRNNRIDLIFGDEEGDDEE
jgi:poly(A) polymerase